MMDKVIAKQVEEAKKAERKRRHLIEDLRYALKRVEPPLSLDASYEDVSLLVPFQVSNAGLSVELILFPFSLLVLSRSPKSPTSFPSSATTRIEGSPTRSSSRGRR